MSFLFNTQKCWLGTSLASGTTGIVDICWASSIGNPVAIRVIVGPVAIPLQYSKKIFHLSCLGLFRIFAVTIWNPNCTALFLMIINSVLSRTWFMSNLKTAKKIPLAFAMIFQQMKKNWCHFIGEIFRMFDEAELRRNCTSREKDRILTTSSTSACWFA